MKPKTPRRLILAFATAFTAAGMPYWMLPYHKVNLPGALLAPGLFVVGISALLLCLYNVAPCWRTTHIMAATVPAVVIVRVLVEGVRDPTSHNLWPLEVIIALLVGLASALPGTVLGLLLKKWLQRRDGGGIA